MVSFRRCIFGLTMNIHGQSDLFMDQLDMELAIYPDSSKEPDISINVVRKIDNHVIAKNPAIHSEYEDGFACNFGNTQIRWHWNEKPFLVEWVLPAKGKNWLRKLFNIQFSHPYQEIGQLFHELVLIPTIHLFYNDRFLLLHGSSVSRKKDNKAIVIGGTGGVGKTSLAIKLVGNKYDFMADDITVIDSKGIVWGNFAWPKIYGYNVIRDEATRSRLFSNLDTVDKIMWHIQMRTRGPDRMRRRISPALFFHRNIKIKSELEKYYILFRKNTQRLTIKRINTNTAVNMSLNIMASEYTILYRHLQWHRYNRSGIGNSLLFNSEENIFHKWELLGKAILGNAECFVVNIPLEMNGLILKNTLPDLL